MVEPAPPNARLLVDRSALVHNWQVFARASGAAACGAAIKADGYGLGAPGVAAALIAAGCRDLFVAHWHEVAALEQALEPWPDQVRVAVLHGVGPAEMAQALASRAVPVLVTAAQVAAWKSTGRPADVMVDTGINRLGLTLVEARSGLLDGLAIDTLHSHLACSEDPGHPLNAWQRAAFADVAAVVPARRHALANSAGIGMGEGFRFDLTRPGIGIYGGGPAPGAEPLRDVAGIAARIIQCRDIAGGDAVGYGATFVAERPTRIAVVALGYADGYPRSLSNRGWAVVDGRRCPLVGRVSMDMSCFDVTDAAPVAEGDWLTIGFDLAETAAAAGRTEYELLTGLGDRYARVYT
ncbi:MAG: alanine racemase [Alphaproteobacteria bacterium PA4]|nr:MAG: alanine racemase [Alphaproteobacteria bacterium PA4]